jgi:hypothetical protein
MADADSRLLVVPDQLLDVSIYMPIPVYSLDPGIEEGVSNAIFKQASIARQT